MRTGKTKNIGVVLFIGCNQYGLQAQWEAIRGDEFLPHQMLQAIVDQSELKGVFNWRTDSTQLLKLGCNSVRDFCRMHTAQRAQLKKVSRLKL